MKPTRHPSLLTSFLRTRQVNARAGRASSREMDPSELLGEDHPLVHGLAALVVVLRVLVAAATVLAACAVGAAAGVSWAGRAGLSTAAFLVALVAFGAVLFAQARRGALVLIADGRERLPLALVEWRRRQLVKRETRIRLAETLARVLEETLIARWAPAVGPWLLVDPVVVRANGSELLAVSMRLGEPPVSARGVALVERLLADAGSALYGDDAEALRAELCRARYLLQSRRPDGVGM